MKQIKAVISLFILALYVIAIFGIIFCRVSRNVEFEDTIKSFILIISIISVVIAIV